MDVVIAQIPIVEDIRAGKYIMVCLNPQVFCKFFKYLYRPADIPEILWFEEETDLIRNCAALSSAVGLQKSFSTTDISQLPSPEDTPIAPGVRSAVSELALNTLQRSNFLLENARLDHTSRSCSTWVAVGDIASTSQLPSPHGGQSTTTVPPTNTPPPTFTAADFIRSVNKKVTSIWN